MRKRLLSILLTGCMVFGLLPQMAMAEEITYTYVSDVTNTGLDLTTAPDYNARYDAGDYGTIYWQPDNKTVILSDAEINVTSGSAFALTLKSDEDVNIVVEGTNVLKAQKCGIGQGGGDAFSGINTTIKGSGTLEATTTEVDTGKGAICLNFGNLTISEEVELTPVVPNYMYPAIFVYNGDLSILDSASIISPSQTFIKLQEGTININTEGTITESFMSSKNNFNYTPGDVNSWVMKTNLSNSPQIKADFVYGDFTLANNQTIQDMDGEDGLTVMEGATLSINDGVTLTVNDYTDIDGIPQITNNGTIVNNGTIQFQDTVDDDTILALTANGTLTGSGVVKKGTKEVMPIDGDVYEVAETVTTTGLDLATSTPTENTCYKADSGYILWQPTVEGGVVKSGIVTLNNASIDTTTTGNRALKLPGTGSNHIDVTIVAEGENSLISTREGISHEGGETLVQGSGTLNANGWLDGILQQNGDLTITGDVTVNATGGMGNYGIYTFDLTILGNANVTANGESADIYSSGNITINTTGTVNAPEINTTQTFELIAGTLTGSWVWEGKGDYYENEVNTIYGNVTIVGENTVSDVSQLDGLTIMEGATLTIDNAGMLIIEDYDEGDVPKIINNGTIVNNGTIKFPEGTAGAEITALNITGSGTIRIGDKDVAIVDGVMYADGGDVSMAGVDFTVDTPTADTYYKAGDNGYMLFSPTNGTLTMNNAVITNDQEEPLITLPKSNIKLVLEGENALTNMDESETGVTAIGQGEVLAFDNSFSVTAPQAYSLTVSGSGSLSVRDYGLEPPSISTDGTFVMESGTLKSGDTSEHCFALTTADFQMKGGSLEVSNNLYIFGNALVQGGTILTPGSDDASGGIGCIGNFEMTGGTVTCGATLTGGLAVYGNINKTGGTLNALVASLEINDKSGVVTITPYGSAPMVAYKNDGSVDADQSITLYLGNPGKEMSYKLNIPSGSTLTIPSGATLNLAKYMNGLNYTDYFTNNGTLVNNGKIVLQSGTTAEEVKAAAAIFKATGTGIIVVPVMEDDPECYTNSGNPMNVVNEIILDTEEKTTDEYTWVGNPTEGFTLTLDNVYVQAGNISLPSNVPVTIALEGNTVVEEGIGFTGGDAGNLTFTGSGAMTLNSGISGAVNGDIVTVQGGATVNVGGRISLGGSGGQDGTLIVDGTGTSLNVTNPMADGIYLDTVQVLNGGQLTVHADTVGIFAGDGGVTITGGSTVNVGCDYGIYVINGKLTIDSTSKLVTNASIAPFCVVDTTGSAAQSDMVSIYSVPTGTAISSATGSSSKYWSLVSTGGTLGVDNEGNEVVTIIGAVKGKVTFAASSGNNNSSSGSSSGGGSATYHIITATAGAGGVISPSGKVLVVSEGSKTFTITANKGYEVKDVLVDGVSVGSVTEYTFKEVSKIHSITASFVEVSEEVPEEVPATTVSYSDVKNSDWFKEAVDYVTENGLMSGVGEGKFGPNISTDRGMIVTILWRLEGQPSATTKSSFTDVADGEYYAEAVAWAAENKIVEGYGNGLFGPKDTITREQMASILYRYSKFKGYDITQGGMAVREFSDYSNISPWALESVTWAVNAGLISGVNESQLDPRGKATRAQVASILMRYCEDVAK
ncbi:MAG: S-layer homology domain-containing protein [Lachnospiraceae bacterium]|nr:S-layer homology domain-containing protein [Lachnospiraceae bacterium]